MAVSQPSLKRPLATRAQDRRVAAGRARRRWIALVIAVVVLCIEGRGYAGDPYFGQAAPPSSGGADRTSPFNDVLRTVEAELTRRYGPLPIAPSLTATQTGERRRDVAARSDERVRFFQGLQIRQLGAPRNLVGDPSPADGTLGALPGTLVAGRFGIIGFGVGGYAVVGGGTFKVFEHDVATDGRLNVLGGTRMFSFVGVGGELHLFPWLLGACEVTYGRLVGPGGSDLVAPHPSDSVRTAVLALRVQY